MISFSAWATDQEDLVGCRGRAVACVGDGDADGGWICAGLSDVLEELFGEGPSSSCVVYYRGTQVAERVFAPLEVRALGTGGRVSVEGHCLSGARRLTDGGLDACVRGNVPAPDPVALPDVLVVWARVDVLRVQVARYCRRHLFWSRARLRTVGFQC